MATELADGVWWFDLRGVNAYLFDERTNPGVETGGGNVTLIDTGAQWTRRELRRDLDDAGVALRDVTRIAITHFDLDHVGGLSGLAFDAPIYAGEPDASILRGERSPGWTNRKTAFQSASNLLLPVPDLAVQTVSDGDMVGGLTGYETPGHTQGHVVYVSEDRSVAFVGDLVRESRGRLESSPWAMTDDQRDVRSSIRRLASLDLDVDVIAMGHGTPFVERGNKHLADLAARF